MSDILKVIEFECVNSEIDRDLAGRILKEITALRAENERLREALEFWSTDFYVGVEAKRIARAALDQAGGE